MKSITATQKGLITGAAMVATSLLIYFSRGNFDNQLQYITYFLYLAGIVWAVWDFSKNVGPDEKFGNYFSAGFKCFIVVTLLMTVFTIVFLLMHPELKEQNSVLTRAVLEKEKNRTPKEIEEKVQMAKESYNLIIIMSTVFWYLVIGAVVTAITGAVLVQSKRNTNQ